MRLLVLGGHGMLGRAVAGRARAPDAGARASDAWAAVEPDWDVCAVGRGELDVTDPAAVRAALRELAPTVVVNCAAWTDVDGAEAEPDAALAVNGAGAGHVARAAAEVGARAIQLSTDYVFSGEEGRPYVESDLPNPRSSYGRSKLAGELEVLAVADAHIVVRTSWLFGQGGRNFVDTMLGLGEEREEVSVVDDQVGCPTWTVDLAGGVLELARRAATGARSGGATGAGSGGVYHVAAAGSCSWYELAREIFDQAGVACRVTPTTTAAVSRPAPRPAFSVLASERADAPRLRSWCEGVRGYLAQSGRLAGAQPDGTSTAAGRAGKTAG